jgi:hypothetical protein
MFTFIAGATSSGARVARATADGRSSASPCASFASECAVPGATRTISAQSASAMWSISPSSDASRSRVRTVSAESVCSTSGATKCVASGVITQRTR